MENEPSKPESASPIEDSGFGEASSDSSSALKQWCADLVERTRGVREAAVLVLDGAAAVPVAMAPQEMTIERRGYLSALRQMQQANAPVVVPFDRPEDDVFEAIALPVAFHGGTGVLLVGLDEMPVRQAELVMAHLQGVLGWVVYHLSQETLQAAKNTVDIQKKGFLVSAEMLDAETPMEARHALVALAADYLGATRATLVRRKLFGGTKVEAVSGETKFDRRSRLNDLTLQAAQEALVRREPIEWCRGQSVNESMVARLAVEQGEEAAIALPLADARGRMSEVIVLQWAHSEAMPKIDDWSSLWILARPIMALHDKASRGALARVLQTLWRGVEALFGPSHVKAKVISAVLVFSIWAVIFVEVPNTLRAEAVVDDPDLRVISAPSEGFIESTSVLPGDFVTKGQELVRLDSTDLRLRAVELQAQMARHEAEAAVARQNRDRGAVAVAEAEAAETAARIALVQRDISASIIRAQADGLVLDGDLRSRLGARVTEGETLMQIAPRRGVELRVSVSNRNGAELEKGLQGTVRLKSAPQEQLSFTLTRVRPGAEPIDGDLRFVAYARLAETDLNLENGMQGVARLDKGTAPIWRVWLLPVYETAYLFFWRWMP
jgi:multidrug efflux pump subunit AcrA (membrane-fusion protein)